MTAPVRLGVLGCADIARRRMLPAAVRSPDVEVVAVAGRDPARADETARAHGCRAYHGYPELLADPDVEAVYVPLPAALHERWNEAALAAGKHVLAEKPVTTAPERTAALYALARRRRLVLWENVMFVHHPQHEAVRALVRDGAIGDLRSLRAEFTVPRRPAGDIRLRPDLGGGCLWDTGVYPVRAALHFLGPHLEVVGAWLSRGPGDAVDTGGAALLRDTGGRTAQLAFGLDHGYRSVYELCGSRGRVVLDHAFTPAADHRPVVRLETPDGRREITLDAHDQVEATLAAFAQGVRHGHADSGPVVRQAELLHEVNTRARHGT
ncbi:Gfo/Idh/MocA family protein [Streptomyces thermolineatus]|uniref:Gfo/Idh/MocA family protein n=1 Tax=Streptomyces thermolineatus TaxID=44033 RepID=UPI00384F6B3A